MLNTDTVRESFLEGKTPINQWRGDQHAGMVYTERKLLLPDHCFSPFNFASGIYASLVVIAFLSLSLSLPLPGDDSKFSGFFFFLLFSRIQQETTRTLFV